MVIMESSGLPPTSEEQDAVGRKVLTILAELYYSQHNEEIKFIEIKEEAS